jgi:uncharacterized protein YjbJ (UPF0337 family)
MAGWLDRLLGRGKKEAGEMTDDLEMRREGMSQEAEGKAEQQADRAEDMAQDAHEEAAEQRAERDIP